MLSKILLVMAGMRQIHHSFLHPKVTQSLLRPGATLLTFYIGNAAQKQQSHLVGILSIEAQHAWTHWQGRDAGFCKGRNVVRGACGTSHSRLPLTITVPYAENDSSVVLSHAVTCSFMTRITIHHTCLLVDVSCTHASSKMVLQNPGDPSMGEHHDHL